MGCSHPLCCCVERYSHPNGDTIEQTELKYPAVDIQFATQKTDGRSRQEGGKQEDSTVSVNMGGKTVLLYNLDDVDNPVELAFQVRRWGPECSKNDERTVW